MQAYNSPGAQTPGRAYVPGLINSAQKRKNPKPKRKLKRKSP